MAEAQKRFPWWLLVCSVLLPIFASVMAFVVTVGRQGTLVGKYDQVEVGMPESTARAIVGRPAEVDVPHVGVYEAWSLWREGPGELTIFWMDDEHGRHVWRVSHRVQRGYKYWHLRRWAEKAWTLIHGPRR